VTEPSAVWPGRHAPLGATVVGDDGHAATSVNFAVWAPRATRVELCLFDGTGPTAHETRLGLTERTLGVWHGRVAGVSAGQLYGFRAHGPWEPEHGLRFNPAKLLLDPYARAICGGYDPRELTYPDADSAPHVPRSVVVGDGFDWGDDRPPAVPWSDTVIYELHVRGFTRRHPDVPAELRGTYAGLAHPAVVGYLRDLGVTAVELLPVHQFVSEPKVTARGLSNYWGYNSIGFFAPHNAYSACGTQGQQVAEFRETVRALHAAGIEVILDVVYNHTAEGPPNGPTLAFRGYDDGAYYRQLHGSYADVTGCGNTFAARQQQALTLVMDSLRYWVTQMHVDGFRFDLAPALTRDGSAVDLRGPFLAAVGQDPVLRDVKLIAEPWDATAEGYSVGEFPPPWWEWNDKFRDTVRDFWRGRSESVRDLGYRLSGSSDLYADDGRLPYSSVNFVTAHDGFTLRDLVSYDRKHNEANGEGGRDGTEDNRSWNCGAEGETDDLAVRALRVRQAANLMTTLLLSTGVPMVVAGDERGRTQGGNNNAYCQDNEVSWLDWDDDAEWAPLHALTRVLLRLRRRHPVLRQRHFFAGRPVVEGGRKDLSWVHPDGREMATADWHDTGLTTLGLFLAGDAIRARGEHGETVTDDSFLVWLHAGPEEAGVVLPDLSPAYDEVLRTDRLDLLPDPAQEPPGGVVGACQAGEQVTLTGRSMLVLRGR
jgi:glycogen debranching enzyme GlgX